MPVGPGLKSRRSESRWPRGAIIPIMELSSFAIPIVFAVFAAAQVAWYIGVLVLLFRIWQKVRHLPG